MALKKYNPTTPGQRQLVMVDRSALYKGKPVKVLTEGKIPTAVVTTPAASPCGSVAAVTRRRIASSTSSAPRSTCPAKVERLEYDPNRTAFIALIKYADGEQAYILAPQRLAVGDTVIAGAYVDVKPGNVMPLGNMPIGTIVHNVEMKIGKGGQIARSAGTYAQLVGRDHDYVIVRLNSGEQRLIHGRCIATIGAVSNPDHMNISIGKAGRTRWLGWRPHNRGVVMNPIDHPHGGGEGRTSGGRHPVTPWGKPTKGKKTRSNKSTNKFIVSSAATSGRSKDSRTWFAQSGKARSSTATLLKKADAARASGRHDVIKIWSRRSTILPQFVGLTFGVYNGQKHVPVSINEEMVGHKFGEFSPTRTFHGHSGDKKAKKA